METHERKELPVLLLVTLVLLSLPLLVFGWWGASKLFDSSTSSHYRSTTPVQRVLLDTGGLDVSIRQGDVSDVAVDLQGTYFIDAPNVTKSIVDGALRVKADCGSGWTMVGCDSTLTVTVPRHTAVSLEGGTGNVALHDLSGDVAIKSDTGDVTGDGLRSSQVVALTSTGDVDLHWALPPSNLDVSTDTGDIDVVVPASRYAVAEKSETGDVALQGILDDSASHRSIRTVSDAGDVSIAAPAA